MIGAFVVFVIALGIAFASGAWTAGEDPVASLRQLQEQEVLFLEQHAAFLVYNQGDPLALSADAQHVGDEVEFCESSQMFESPAHGEKFDIRGYYYGGPAAKGLDRYPVRIEGDGIFVDLDRPIAGPPRGAGAVMEPQGSFCVP